MVKSDYSNQPLWSAMESQREKKLRVRICKEIALDAAVASVCFGLLAFVGTL